MARSSHTNHVKFEGPATYCIVVKGGREERLSDRLAGMRITSESRGDEKPVTSLAGRLLDQAQLSGVLNALYEIHLPILSVEVLDGDPG